MAGESLAFACHCFYITMHIGRNVHWRIGDDTDEDNLIEKNYNWWQYVLQPVFLLEDKNAETIKSTGTVKESKTR